MYSTLGTVLLSSILARKRTSGLLATVSPSHASARPPRSNVVRRPAVDAHVSVAVVACGDRDQDVGRRRLAPLSRQARHRVAHRAVATLDGRGHHNRLLVDQLVTTLGVGNPAVKVDPGQPTCVPHRPSPFPPRCDIRRVAVGGQPPGHAHAREGAHRLRARPGPQYQGPGEKNRWVRVPVQLSGESRRPVRLPIRVRITEPSGSGRQA